MNQPLGIRRNFRYCTIIDLPKLKGFCNRRFFKMPTHCRQETNNLRYRFVTRWKGNALKLGSKLPQNTQFKLDVSLHLVQIMPRNKNVFYTN